MLVIILCLIPWTALNFWLFIRICRRKGWTRIAPMVMLALGFYFANATLVALLIRKPYGLLSVAAIIETLALAFYGMLLFLAAYAPLTALLIRYVMRHPNPDSGPPTQK